MKAIKIFLSTLVITSFMASCSNSNKATEVAETVKTKKGKDIPYKLAKNYFSNANEIINPKIESQEELESLLGMATTMGADGIPTPIDFKKEYVIAVVLPATSIDTQLVPVSLEKKNRDIEFTYKVKTGEQRGYQTKPFLAIIVDKKNDGKVVLVQE